MTIARVLSVTATLSRAGSMRSSIGIGTGVETDAAIELLRLPRPQSFTQLFGELVGIGRRFVGERRQISGFLMVAMSIRRRAAESRIDDERPEHADDAHVVGKRVALAPLHRGFGARLGEAVVEGVAEVLLRAIEAPRLQQLLGANDAERVEQFRADDVLAAFAAVQRNVGHTCMIAARCSRDERRVLVIRMRARMQHARRRLQPLQHLRQATCPRVVNRPDLCLPGEHEDARPESGNYSASHRVQSIWG